MSTASQSTEGYCLLLDIDWEVPGDRSTQYSLNFYSLWLAAQLFLEFSAKPIKVGQRNIVCSAVSDPKKQCLKLGLEALAKR